MTGDQDNQDEITDADGEAIDPSGSVALPTVPNLPEGYCYGVTRFADVVISTALPDRFAELLTSLENFTIPLDELRAGGGGRTPFVKRFDDSLGTVERQDGSKPWGKQNITIERRIGFDGDTHPVARTRGHEIDMFGQGSSEDPFPGVAVEMEWNNKDPFFHRDLINFQALHREGAIVAGVIVTRGPLLQKTLSTVLDKYGGASTHWEKLIRPVNLGGGGECPLLLIGIEPGRVDDGGVLDEHMGYAAQAHDLKQNWADRGYSSWVEAKPEVDSFLERAQITRL